MRISWCPSEDLELNKCSLLKGIKTPEVQYIDCPENSVASIPTVFHRKNCQLYNSNSGSNYFAGKGCWFMLIMTMWISDQFSIDVGLTVYIV